VVFQLKDAQVLWEDTTKTAQNLFYSCKLFLRCVCIKYNALEKNSIAQIYLWLSHVPNTGRFIMFSMITNIYNKKVKEPTLMELFTATGILEKGFFLQLEMIDVCTTGDTAHIEHL